MNYIRSFSEVGKGDIGLVGGKGANLGETTQAGLPVPPGFCLTAPAYRAFIESTGASAEIHDILAGLTGADPTEIDARSERIRACIIARAIPGEIAAQVVAAYCRLGTVLGRADGGDETAAFGFATTDWPASSPWVTAVGGTSLGVSQANTRALETGWGTSNYYCNTTTPACGRTGWLYGAGGGVSRIFAEPAYQGNASLTLSGRGVPDVAALGDPQTGLLIGQTQTFPGGLSYDEFRISGTSVSSPIFAGLMALADQKAGFAHGFANPLFYVHPAAFYDVLSVKTAVARRNFTNRVDASAGTADRLRTFDDYSGSPTQHTNAGWDNVTGLGTPTSNFLNTFGQ
jgi:Pyruvate phosphate dikinase, AMP/ATP-binding domain